MNDDPLYGLIEAGGTKFVLGIARSHDEIISSHRISTTGPSETLRAVVDWFGNQPPLAALGIASFGPLDVDLASPTWGYITRTTKAGWDNCNVAQHLGDELNCPVAIDTDVNGAVLAESLWGAGIEHRVSLYLTVGTGIGGGAVIDGQILRGLSHPEMGHIRVPRHVDDLDFAGVCKFHKDCLEGLASGPAILARWGASLSDLPADHIGHEIIAYYLAQTIVTLQSIFEPGKIIIGGGVSATAGLIERVRAEAGRLGQGYFVGKPDDIVTLPGLGDHSGLLGALALAQRASA
jgi:fructokinase